MQKARLLIIYDVDKTFVSSLMKGAMIFVLRRMVLVDIESKKTITAHCPCDNHILIVSATAIQIDTGTHGCNIQNTHTPLTFLSKRNGLDAILSISFESVHWFIME